MTGMAKRPVGKVMRPAGRRRGPMWAVCLQEVEVRAEEGRSLEGAELLELAQILERERVRVGLRSPGRLRGLGHVARVMLRGLLQGCYSGSLVGRVGSYREIASSEASR